MAEIVYLCPVVALPDPYRELQHQRTRMASAWMHWLATNPAAEHVTQEIDGTTGAMRALADLANIPRT